MHAKYDRSQILSNMIDHFNLPVSNLKLSGRFYKTVLKALEYALLVQVGDAIGVGDDTWAFGIVQENGQFVPMHIAFKASSPDAVRAFYRTALDLGAKGNGEPGYRAQYGPSYYSAFFYDPDGHNIEAVCRD